MIEHYNLGLGFGFRSGLGFGGSGHFRYQVKWVVDSASVNHLSLGYSFFPEEICFPVILTDEQRSSACLQRTRVIYSVYKLVYQHGLDTACINWCTSMD